MDNFLLLHTIHLAVGCFRLSMPRLKTHSKVLFSSRALWNRTSVFLPIVFFYSEETPNSRSVLYLKLFYFKGNAMKREVRLQSRRAQSKTANFCRRAYIPCICICICIIITQKKSYIFYSQISNNTSLRSLISSLVGLYSIKSIGNQKDFL